MTWEVKTVKQLLKNTQDPHLALLSYRSTPLPQCGKSPVELLMGRNLRSTLPQISSTLIPQWPYLKKFKHQNNLFKSRQKTDYDRRHRVLEIPDIPDVWITTNGQPTTRRTVTTAGTPRSYTVQTRNGHIRRNRSQLNVDPRQPSDTGVQTSPYPICSPIQTRSHTLQGCI